MIRDPLSTRGGIVANVRKAVSRAVGNWGEATYRDEIWRRREIHMSVKNWQRRDAWDKSRVVLLTP